MKKHNEELMASVDTLLHLNDLNRYCDKKKVSYEGAVEMGARFIHTFHDEPMHNKPPSKNHDYLTRLKMFNVQL